MAIYPPPIPILLCLMINPGATSTKCSFGKFKGIKIAEGEAGPGEASVSRGHTGLKHVRMLITLTR